MSFQESDLPLAEPSEVAAVISEAETIISESYKRATETRLAKAGRFLLQCVIRAGEAQSGAVDLFILPPNKT